MGTFITFILAVLIFGIGLSLFFRAIKKEATEGACASCSPDKNCCNKKISNFDEFKN